MSPSTRRLPALLLLGAATLAAGGDMRRSGYDDMGPALQAMQRDDSQNPALLWVQEGEQLYRAAAGSQPSCLQCHGRPELPPLRDAALHHPAHDATLGRAVTLGQRINLCRERHQRLPPWPAESQPLLALESYLALQARGRPIAPPADPRLDPERAAGEQLYRRRIGQLDLACAQCHDDHAGQRLAGSLIPQGHPTGYPLYRLEWQGLGSLQRRLRGCMTGVRAEPYAFDAAELVALELYLKQRAAGMASDAPAVRP